MRSANLSGAILVGANLNAADLMKADLTYADLSNADLQSASLTGANLMGADLSQVRNLSAKQLKTAIFSPDTSLPRYLKEEMGGEVELQDTPQEKPQDLDSLLEALS